MTPEEIQKLEKQAIALIDDLKTAAETAGRSPMGRALNTAATAAEVTALRIQTLYDGGTVKQRPPRNNQP